MHIAVAGNIGSGKTTLTKLLAKHYGWSPRFEPVDNNPYLEDFYADMSRWSFNLQIYFLNKRFKEVVEISQSDANIIQDRTIYEDACIFAPNLHGQGHMSDRDFNNYKDLFELMMSLVKMPDLMIYIRSTIPNLVQQIQKRGRDYEQTMRLDYLEGLNKRFKEVVEISQSDENIIQDRTIYEDACIFAPNLHGQGHMSDRDFNNYRDLFELMMSLVKMPDLMIYIRSTIPNLVQQIQKRGREYEQTMRLDYLEGLNKRYEDWIADYKGNLVIINGDEIKFGDKEEDFQKVCDKIDANLFGIFSPFNQQR